MDLRQAAHTAYQSFNWNHPDHKLDDILNELGDSAFVGWRYKQSNSGAPWHHLITLRADQFKGQPLLQDLAQCIEWLAANSLDRYVSEVSPEPLSSLP